MKKKEMFTKIFGDGKIKIKQSKKWAPTTSKFIHEDKSKRHPRQMKHKKGLLYLI